VARHPKVHSQRVNKLMLQSAWVMGRINNMPDTSDICQEELDQWSDINNSINNESMDDSHNPNYINDQD
jgi:hypothetical protein